MDGEGMAVPSFQHLRDRGGRYLSSRPVSLRASQG